MKQQHRKFAEAYLLKPIAKEAAIVAGYGEKYAAERGSDLLKREDVKAYLAERTSKAIAVVDSTVERITNELAAIGFADRTSIFTEREDGVLVFRPLAEWPAEVRACIASIETKRERTTIKNVKADSPDEADQLTETFEIVTKVRFYGKVEALKLLGLYRKMFGSDIVPPGGGGGGFVGLAITVAPGAQANIQVNTGKGGK